MYLPIFQTLFLSTCRPPRWLSGKESSCQCQSHRRLRFNPWVRKIPWRRKWLTHSSILAWKIPWTEEPMGYSPWGRKESDRHGAPTPTFLLSHSLSYHHIHVFHFNQCTSTNGMFNSSFLLTQIFTFSSRLPLRAASSMKPSLTSLFQNSCGFQSDHKI